jgi:hypothetical protein
VDTHRSEENNYAKDVWILLRPWVDSNDDVKEEDASKKKVKAHHKMSKMTSHQQIESRSEVEKEE